MRLRTIEKEHAMSVTRKLIGVVAAACGLVALPAAPSYGHQLPRAPELVGRAVLPADALADGPRSGAAQVPMGQQKTVINGIEFPRPSQPIAGFSAIVAGREPGEYLAMADNGFGNKQNSRDFLIRAYYVAPDFKTARGGTGTVDVRDFIEFRDPNNLIGFPLVNEGTAERLLTGADIDPESLQRGHRGDFWVGEEFGPWILHFDASGVLLDPPFKVPALKSPSNPFLAPREPFTQPSSRGFEAMSITPNGKYLYGVLEGATVADLTTDPRRRIVYEFSTKQKAFTGRTWSYHVAAPTPLVSDMFALDDHRMVLMERDGAIPGVFRDVYVVDVRTGARDGELDKTPAVNLAMLADPKLISLPALHAGDVGLGNPYRVACESVEAIYVIDGTRLLIGCDNNLPNTGRNPTRADDSEFIVVRAPGLTSRPWQQ
jgi:hypothetical protein